jgi:tRNA A37 methylthiotransferase MiaB
MKPLTTQVIKERSVRLSKIYGNIILEQNRKYVGRSLSCLVTDKDRRLARAPNFKQVFLNGRADGLVNAKIVEANRTYLRGNIKK